MTPEEEQNALLLRLENLLLWRKLRQFDPRVPPYPSPEVPDIIGTDAVSTPANTE